MATDHEKHKNRKIKSNKPAKSTSGHAATPGPDRDATPTVPLKLQQQCLDIFRDAFNPSSDDAATLQEVKGHLYNRDFGAAFGKESYLRVYASRWSPSRALAYLDVLTDVRPHLDSKRNHDIKGPFSALCLGGGAGGELVALAGWLKSRREEEAEAIPDRLNVVLIDIADWTGVIEELRIGITTPPQLSKYASQAKKDANEALIDESDISVHFQRQDLLAMDKTGSEETEVHLSKASLVTFMFTLNELYSASVSNTQELLQRITSLARSGTLLLVIDSPGSYSTVSLNGTVKKYPMQWLLDYTLLGSPKAGGSDAKWKKLIDDSSRWFRLPAGLNYPIELENMRYQIHLYRRLDDDQ